jgi:branched-chain amino acid transport system substrate-binding protein
MTAIWQRRAWLLMPMLAVQAFSHAYADKQYGPGVSDGQIVIGQTMPYSGPLSAFGTLGRAQAAYFAMINERGGVNGRKIKLISLDDGYSPPRTVEQTRKLVESEQVLLLFSSLGSPTNVSVLKYLNAKRVPQLFIAATGMTWGDPGKYPWTMAFLPSQRTGAAGYVRYVLENKPQARIGILYQNDDFGNDYLKAVKELLGDNAARMIVSEQAYEFTDPTVDSQIVSLKASGADVFFNFGSPKFAAQAIRKAYDIGWRPLEFIAYTATSVSAVLQPAGADKAVGILSSAYLKDPTDPQWKDDPATRDWVAWMEKYYPQGDRADIYNVYGYAAAQIMVHVLEQCGDNLTRENVMHHAGSLKDVRLPMLLPGISLNTSATDYDPVKQMQLMRFNGRQWVRFGPVVGR